MILDGSQAAAHHLAEEPSEGESQDSSQSGQPCPECWKEPKRLAPQQYYNFPALRAESDTGQRAPPG